MTAADRDALTDLIYGAIGSAEYMCHTDHRELAQDAADAVLTAGWRKTDQFRAQAKATLDAMES